jgi:Holliday junction resolvase-like predicted endonuclease
MPSPRQQFGTQAEQQAADFLLLKGMTVIDRHVTSRYGEIDLLMHDGDTVVADALHDILEKRGWSQIPYRIDVVTIEPSGIAHLKGVGPE